MISHDLNMVRTRREYPFYDGIDHRISQIRAERKQHQPEREGTVAGDVEALPAPEDADKYVIVRKKEAEKSQEQH